MKAPAGISRLNLLVGSLAMDENFRQEFMQDRLKAIERFNTEIAPQNGQKPIELTEGELKLVNALKACSIEEFVSLLAVINDLSILPLPVLPPTLEGVKSPPSRG